MLTKNQIAPDIKCISISGQNIDLGGFRGKKVLVKFHRFSGCPVAQRQVHDLIKKQNVLSHSGIETIIFLSSSAEKIRPVYKEVPGLHIIGDADRKFYRQYHSQFSWLKTFSLVSWVEIFKSFAGGYFPLFKRFQGAINGIPSDFLIGTDGKIADLHYGRHAGDSWSDVTVLAKI